MRTKTEILEDVPNTKKPSATDKLLRLILEVLLDMRDPGER